MRTRDLLATAMLLSMGTSGCADLSEQDAQDDSQEEVGTATLSLTKSPADAQCLRIKVEGAARNLTKLLPLTNGQSSIFRLEGLPVGVATFTGEAFNAPCAGVFVNSVRSWYSEPVQAQVKISPAVHVVLEMIRNGRAEVAVDFDETNGPKSDSLRRRASRRDQLQACLSRSGCRGRAWCRTGNRQPGPLGRSEPSPLAAKGRSPWS